MLPWRIEDPSELLAGVRISTVRVFVKGIGDAGLDEYLAHVERDRPGSTSA